VNAIYAMAKVIDVLAEHAAELSKSTPHPVLGPPSLSVGRIMGGQGVNVVPDECLIEVDRRVIPGETLSDCLTMVQSALRKRLGSLDGMDFKPFIEMPPLSAAGGKAAPWVEAIRGAIQTATGHNPAITGVPYGTDAGPLGATGLPCLVFGPGDIAQAHTKDEWVELDQVCAAAEAYYQIACALGS